MMVLNGGLSTVSSFSDWPYISTDIIAPDSYALPISPTTDKVEAVALAMTRIVGLPMSKQFIAFVGGASLRDLLHAVVEIGCCQASLWDSPLNPYSRPTPQAYNDASYHKAGAYYRLSTLADLKNCIARGYPVIHPGGLIVGYDANTVLPSDEMWMLHNVRTLPVQSFEGSLQMGIYPESGTYSTLQEVFLTKNKPGSIIYRIDGGTWLRYTGPFVINTSCLVEYYYTEDDIRSAQYIIEPAAVHSPESGIYTAVTFILSVPEMYSVNGGPEVMYTGPVDITETSYIRYKSGSVIYTIGTGSTIYPLPIDMPSDPFTVTITNCTEYTHNNVVHPYTGPFQAHLGDVINGYHYNVVDTSGDWVTVA
jgi:hypothetical protein